LPAPLSVRHAQPTGEIANLAQAAEIRVRFSERWCRSDAFPTM